MRRILFHVFSAYKNTWLCACIHVLYLHNQVVLLHLISVSEAFEKEARHFSIESFKVEKADH